MGHWRAWGGAALLLAAMLLGTGCDDYAHLRQQHGLGPVSAGTFAAIGALRRPAAEAPRPAATPGSCDDIPLLMGPHAPAGAQGRPAGDQPHALRGFTISPPSGADWCELVAQTRSAVLFVRNPYGGRMPDPPPEARQRAHVLMAIAFLIRNDDGTRFTEASLARMLDSCVGSARCAVQNEQRGRVTLDGTACIRATGRTVDDLEIGQIHILCIHPRDPRHAVKLLVLETHQKDAPFYRPPLLDTAQAELQGFIDSLRFTPIAP